MFDSLKAVHKNAAPLLAGSVGLERLTKIYCRVMELAPEDIMRDPHFRKWGARSRHLQRWALWALARELTAASYPQIARRFGYECHSTVVHGIGQLQAVLTADPVAAQDYRDLLELCRKELSA